MPCHYDDFGASERIRRKAEIETRKELNELTRMLCDACNQLQVHGIQLLNNSELSNWWIKHQEDDRKRIAKEKDKKEVKRQQEERVKATKQALKDAKLKLTAEQIKLLGLDKFK